MFLMLPVYISPISGAYTVVGLPSVVDIHAVAGVPAVFSIRMFPRDASSMGRINQGTYKSQKKTGMIHTGTYKLPCHMQKIHF